MTGRQKLRAEEISLSYGELGVIDRLSFTLRPGECLAVLGASGCGKSSLLQVIAGLLPPDKGKVYIDGEDITGQSGRISFMQQKDLLLPWKTLEQNLMLPLLIQGMRKNDARKRLGELLPRFGLQGFALSFPDQLSGGMRQRAALLRSYLFRSDILLLDEPFGALDALTRRSMQAWLGDLIRSRRDSAGITALLVSHDVEEAVLLADRILILSDRPAHPVAEVEISLSAEQRSCREPLRRVNDYKQEVLSHLGN